MSRIIFQIACVSLLASASPSLRGAETSDPLAWPAITREARPGAYWWWLGSAVDPTNLTRELRRYHDAGMGAVHIIPIYGAKGWEDRFIPYLSTRWIEMLRFVVAEADRFDLNVDMTTGTGWCFGGPRVSTEEANAAVVVKTFDVTAGAALTNKVDRKSTQALVAFSTSGKWVELTGTIREDGTVDWTAPAGTWRVYAISQRPSGQKVKRASPGGEGPMLNLLYSPAMTNYLRWFDEAFSNYTGPKPRAMYHDSYEYRTDWSPDFFAQFAKRRGYRLENELPALFGKENTERAARVKCDYRETISDLMAEETLPLWAEWSRRHGFITRNEAHGSPGNLLDLYATADIPETEMFHLDRNKLVSKFASSSAHVSGKRLVASETGTWLREHFTETLADMKYLLDDLFVSGVNHVFYHGTCYSPDEAPWPGWLFYASYEMNPRNSIWRDVPALNAYAARCQAVLQSGRPDNDILLYWPIHDYWQNAAGQVQAMTVHARGWFEGQPIGRLATQLWSRGYAFDYVSDRQLAKARAGAGGIVTEGGAYRVVLVPRCEVMPVATFSNLVRLAEGGATILFEDALPKDVPGWNALDACRAAFKSQIGRLNFSDLLGGKLREARMGQGRVAVGEAEAALSHARVARETMMDHEGLCFIRRAFDGGRHYFIANRGESRIDGWLPIAMRVASAVIMDPMTGRSGVAAVHTNALGASSVRLQLEPGESILLRTFDTLSITDKPWRYWQASGAGVELSENWSVKFLSGGPTIPPPIQSAKLSSWTSLGGEEAQRFAGTAVYSLRFDAPDASGGPWFLELGRVEQSARVRLNGEDLGTRIAPPFRVFVRGLKSSDNLLEVEVTNVSANRIRDLDRRGVKWRTFYDINLVNIDYKPFDASQWPLADSGLPGPARFIPVVPAE